MNQQRRRPGSGVYEAGNQPQVMADDAGLILVERQQRQGRLNTTSQVMVRRGLCLLRMLAYMLLAEFLIFKVVTLLTGTMELVNSVALFVVIVVTLGVIAVIGLLDETVTALVVLTILLLLTPGLRGYLLFLGDNFILLVNHLLIALYLCRRSGPRQTRRRVHRYRGRLQHHDVP